MNIPKSSTCTQVANVASHAHNLLFEQSLGLGPTQLFLENYIRHTGVLSLIVTAVVRLS